MQWLLGYFLCHSIDSSSPSKLSRVGHQLRRLPGCNFSGSDVVRPQEMTFQSCATFLPCKVCKKCVKKPWLEVGWHQVQVHCCWSLESGEGHVMFNNNIASLRIFLRYIRSFCNPPWYDVTILNGNPPEHRRASSQGPSSDQPGCGKWKSWKVPQFES